MNPLFIQKVDKAIPLCLTIFIFYEKLIQVFQFSEFDIQWLITPNVYSKEWKHMVTVLIDFTNFRDEQEERHKQIESSLKQQENDLIKLAQKLNSEIDSKAKVKNDYNNSLDEVKKVNKLINLSQNEYRSTQKLVSDQDLVIQNLQT